MRGASGRRSCSSRRSRGVDVCQNENWDQNQVQNQDQDQKEDKKIKEMKIR